MEEIVKIPITDELDLHTFNPKEVGELLDEYINECIRLKIFKVRIIHGKGKGILKRSVHSVLNKNPNVSEFFGAPETRGGWGATIAVLDKVKQS